jgi:DNA-binding MarR family transcriptional regulator
MQPSGVPPNTLPFPTLLSFALVAYTIEFDNEAERRLQHGASRSRRAERGPWLVSLPMYVNCLRFVDDDGITLDELLRRAHVRPNLAGMERWGYLRVDPATHTIRATRSGLQARAIWEPLFAELEERWRSRFGLARISGLRTALVALLDAIDLNLPEALPILRTGLLNHLAQAPRPPAAAAARARLPLSALFSQVLLAFALHYERTSELSLAIGANVLRPLSDGVARLRDLPDESGVSKESIAMAMSFLTKRGYAAGEKNPGGARLVRLTESGAGARDEYRKRLAAVEAVWRKRFGDPTIDALATALARVVVEKRRKLFEGIRPHPENWRAEFPPPQTLPYFPMVLHRGAYPDGS